MSGENKVDVSIDLNFRVNRESKLEVMFSVDHSNKELRKVFESGGAGKVLHQGYAHDDNVSEYIVSFDKVDEFRAVLRGPLKGHTTTVPKQNLLDKAGEVIKGGREKS